MFVAWANIYFRYLTYSLLGCEANKNMQVMIVVRMELKETNLRWAVGMRCSITSFIVWWR